MLVKPIVIEDSKLIYLINKVYNNRLLGLSVYPFIFLKDTKKENDNISTIYNHELIHHLQSEETLVICFPLISLTHFIYNLCKFRNMKKAYLNICFEKEAYKYMSDLDYINNRKRFAWLHSATYACG